ncbi:Reticulocyte-binding protein 2 a [Madurella mycetomatis]|uniref:Reticulocyte-binding protein 2 a n=1 Tax=Madurella mycetomatis TaxID=100816 RepID=A0A175VSU0_9PEZI|nr:Reticulocyte-binding protein 2 a [Madurella mycetomatis]
MPLYSATTVNFATEMDGSEAADTTMKCPTNTANISDGDNFVNSDSAHKANETLATKLSDQPVSKTADEPTGRPADRPAGEHAVKSAKKLVPDANIKAMPCAKPASAAKNDDKKAASVAKTKKKATEIVGKSAKGNVYCQHDWRQLFLVMAYYPNMLEDMMKIPAFKKMVAKSGGKIPRDHEMRIKMDDPDVLHDVMDLPSFRKFAEESRLSSSYDNPLKGPVCANPLCGKPGHTIAICPGPVHAEFGWMLGCFFCNQYDHYADDCPMMATVTVPALITHLITNRAGLPPFCTQIDWVALAVDNWDLVDMASLPLTREFVKTRYVPSKMWNNDWVGDRSPLSDPLLVGIDIRTLRKLAKGSGDGDGRSPLMEAAYMSSAYLCSSHQSAVQRNPALKRYVATLPHGPKTAEEMKDAVESELDRTLREFEGLKKKKPQPKAVDKVRMGRRAMKKAAEAAQAQRKLNEYEKKMTQLEEMAVERWNKLDSMQRQKMTKVITEDLKRVGIFEEDLKTSEGQKKMKAILMWGTRKEEEIKEEFSKKLKKDSEEETKKTEEEDDEEDEPHISERLLNPINSFDEFVERLCGISSMP